MISVVRNKMHIITDTQALGVSLGAGVKTAVTSYTAALKSHWKASADQALRFLEIERSSSMSLMLRNGIIKLLGLDDSFSKLFGPAPGEGFVNLDPLVCLWTVSRVTKLHEGNSSRNVSQLWFLITSFIAVWVSVLLWNTKKRKETQRTQWN